MYFRNTCLAGVYAETAKYFKALEEYEKNISHINNVYANESKAQRLKENEATKPDKDATIERLRKYRDLLLEQLYETELDSKNLTPDFEFLKLPVTLKPDEITALYQRNIKNPMFTRTLKEYCNEHKIFIDIPDATAQLRNDIENFCGMHMQYLTLAPNGIYVGKTLWDDLTDADYAEWRSWDVN